MSQTCPPSHPAGAARRLRHVSAIVRQVLVGVWHDGFIHAGNLAYMAILSLFPFFVVVGAVFSMLGEGAERLASVHAFLGAMPPVVARVLEPVASDVIAKRHGWLLWVGGLVGLWTVTSLIESLREILRRAYDAPASGVVWLRHRLLSGAITMLAVVVLLVSLYAQVALGAAQEVIRALLPALSDKIATLWFSQAVPGLVLFAALWLLFWGLTPTDHRRSGAPQWPGALLVTLWWGVVSVVLPTLLHTVFKYDLTYGSLAGVMIALFFFWLVGLGMVTGAELNAALAVAGATPRAGGNDNAGDTRE